MAATRNQLQMGVAKKPARRLFLLLALWSKSCAPKWPHCLWTQLYFKNWRIVFWRTKRPMGLVWAVMTQFAITCSKVCLNQNLRAAKCFLIGAEKAKMAFRKTWHKGRWVGLRKATRTKKKRNSAFPEDRLDDWYQAHYHKFPREGQRRSCPALTKDSAHFPLQSTPKMTSAQKVRLPLIKICLYVKEKAVPRAFENNFSYSISLCEGKENDQKLSSEILLFVVTVCKNKNFYKWQDGTKIIHI